ncbi:MAG: hypothetical protein ACTSXF_10345, partial [Promethearchaeota archaeon]
LIILNNYYVAMTGHQPTLTTFLQNKVPVSGKNQYINSPINSNVGFAVNSPPILRIDHLIEGLGTGIKKSNIINVDGYNIPELIRTFRKTFHKYIPQYNDKEKHGSMGNKDYANNNQDKITSGEITDINNTSNIADIGTTIIIINAECALMKKKRARLKWNRPHGPERGEEVYLTISQTCPQCNRCYVDYGCTAIKYIQDSENNRMAYQIDENACLKEYCEACLDVCPNNSILKIIVKPNSNYKSYY